MEVLLPNMRIERTPPAVSFCQRLSAAHAHHVGRLAIVRKATKILEFVCYDFYQGVLRHTHSTNGRRFS
jgi:hypothetical protein